MDDRPIGFFDSGLGGLTCIPNMLDALPNERIIYFGDTARTPYGSKTAATIRKFAFEVADFLIEAQGVKMVVIACNTVSAVALSDLRSRHPSIPILGIISPASHAVAKLCAPGDHIGIIGTKATIASKTYPRKILGYNPALDIHQQACPAFVPLIEEGILQNHIMDLTIRYYLDQFLEYNQIGTLVLGCTHYPLIRRNIMKLYPELRIIDPSEEIVTSIRAALLGRGICADEAPSMPRTEHVFCASDLSEGFVGMINLIFSGTDYPITFKNFDLESYLEQKGESNGF